MAVGIDGLLPVTTEPKHPAGVPTPAQLSYINTAEDILPKHPPPVVVLTACVKLTRPDWVGVKDKKAWSPAK